MKVNIGIFFQYRYLVHPWSSGGTSHTSVNIELSVISEQTEGICVLNKISGQLSPWYRISSSLRRKAAQQLSISCDTTSDVQLGRLLVEQIFAQHISFHPLHNALQCSHIHIFAQKSKPHIEQILWWQKLSDSNRRSWIELNIFSQRRLNDWISENWCRRGSQPSLWRNIAEGKFWMLPNPTHCVC